MKGIYHLSQTPRMKILRPSPPAEDIIGGVVVWAMDNPLPKSSDCVCCGLDAAAILEHNPMLSGYIYEPLTTEQPRLFYKEAAIATDWLDSVRTGEVRFYRPVKCRMIGTFRLDVTSGGLRPVITWQS